MIRRIDRNDIAQILKHDMKHDMKHDRDTTCYQADQKDKQTEFFRSQR